MTDFDIKKRFDPLLKKLADEKTLDVAEEIISSILALLNQKSESRFLLNVPRIDAELSRFELAPNFARHPAAFEIPVSQPEIFDVKLFWVKKATKTNLSWLIGVTPNFEDSEANDYKSIGIDFVVPSACDSLIVLLSNRYKIRSLELRGPITQTQTEIFSTWMKIDVSELHDQREIKEAIHSSLWESFDFEPVNRKFYLELVEHFGLLVNHLEKTHGRKPSVMFTTRLLGRILFIWFLRKKGLICQSSDYFSLGSAFSQSTYYKERLESLFFEVLNREVLERSAPDKTTPYLNGGLFDIASTDFYQDEKLTFPNGFFHNLFATLYRYNFTVDESSAEFQQVAIDPEMLGRIFESLLAEQVDEETGGVKRKATGAFYTPREIVTYMCERTIIEFLKKKVPFSPERDRRIEELVTLPETIFRDQDQNKRRDWKPYCDSILNALLGDKDHQALAIFDPAVGSGAFPMGMLQLLVKIYGRLDTKYEKNIADLKRKILANSLYGVDIEQTAIEICRLRAWLSIIVDVDENSGVEPLPNLDFKFTCANALIQLTENKQETLFSDTQLKDKLMEIRDKYYITSSSRKKLELQKKYNELTHTEGLFDDKRTKQLKSYKPFDISASSIFYDPELHHGIPCFDIVIGNPPYVGEKGNKTIFREVADSPLGERFYQGKSDLFYYFFHLGLDYLKEGGVLAFITTNYFITASGATNLRADLAARATVLQMLNFGVLKVFDSAKGQHNLITILEKGRTNSKARTCHTRRQGYLGSEMLSSIVSFSDPETNYFELSQEELFSDGVIRLGKTIIDDLLDRTLRKNLTIGQVTTVSEGIQTGANSVFVFDGQPDFYDELSKKEQALIKPFYKNSDIKKYFYTEKNSKTILYVRSDIALENEFPKIYAYLKSHKEILSKRAQIRRSKQAWYSLLWARDVQLFESEAIVTSYRPQSPAFAYKSGSFYSGTDTYYITKPKPGFQLKILLACLNSKFASVWFRYRGKIKGEILEMTGDNIEAFPIPDIQSLDSATVDEINSKVSLLIDNKSSREVVQKLEDELDSLVFKAYGFNLDEAQQLIDFEVPSSQ